MIIDWAEKQSLPQIRRRLLVQGVRLSTGRQSIVSTLPGRTLRVPLVLFVLLLAKEPAAEPERIVKNKLGNPVPADDKKPGGLTDLSDSVSRLLLGRSVT